MCNLLLGIVDVLAVALIILPLYPNPMDGFIYSVNLFNYADISSAHQLLYWTVFLTFVVLGGVKIVLTQLGVEKGQKIVTMFSVGLSVLSVLFLGMVREPYALVVEFVLFVLKVVLLFKYAKNV